MNFASYISGFVDGEGCFSVSFNFREKLKIGIEVRPSFSIGQNARSLSLLKDIKKFFHCGSIRFSKKDQCYKYEVRNILNLNKYILPHFKNYPLCSSKRRDYELFEEVCNKIIQKEHLDKNGLKRIIFLAYEMNEFGKKRYRKEEFLTALNKVKI